MILLTYLHDLVQNQLVEGWNAEVSKGGFVRHSRAKREPSEKPEHVKGEEDTGDGVDEEAEEDSEGVDASSLLSRPVEGCIRTYQKYHNLERHLFFGKCKLVSEKYTLLDTATLTYAEKVREGLTTQPTLAFPTTTEVSSESPLVQGWALKGTREATRFNENQRQYLDDKFQIRQQSGHKADPEKVSRDIRYARAALRHGRVPDCTADSELLFTYCCKIEAHSYRKAPYITFISDLVGSCSCTKV